MTGFSPDKHPRDSEGKFTNGPRPRGSQRRLAVQKVVQALLPERLRGDRRQA